MNSFWDFFWLTVWIFFFMAYLIILFNVVIDLFRDRGLSGVAKAIWVFFLIVVPALTALVYLITRGSGMAERQAAELQKAQAQTDAYIREVAGVSPTEQITAAKKLLDDGAITADEFATLKAKALA